MAKIEKKAKILLINLGRIEKLLIFNLLLNNFEIVGIISDLEIEKIAYFLEYDSNHGKFFPGKINYQKTKNNKKLILQDDQKISIDIFSTKEATPAKLKELKIDFVFDCSSNNLQAIQLNKYAKYSRKVIISANHEFVNKSEHKLAVFPFNHNKITEKDKIILIPKIETIIVSVLIKALQDKLKIESCYFESLRGPCNKMNNLDYFSSAKGLTLGRSVFSNIIPDDFVSANSSLKKLLKTEDINMEIYGERAFFPINTGSLLKIHFQIKKIHKTSEVNDLLNQEADAQIGFSLKPLVAKDIESTQHYGVIDKNLTQILSTKNHQTLILGIWFDHESSAAISFFKTIQFLAGDKK